MITFEEFLNDLRELLGTDEIIDLNTDLLDIDSWDSYSAFAFIAMAEKKYNKKIEPYLIAEAVFVEDLYNCIV